MGFVKSKVDQNVLLWLYLGFEYSGVPNIRENWIANFLKKISNLPLILRSYSNPTLGSQFLLNMY